VGGLALYGSTLTFDLDTAEIGVFAGLFLPAAEADAASFLIGNFADATSFLPAVDLAALALRVVPADLPAVALADLALLDLAERGVRAFAETFLAADALFFGAALFTILTVISDYYFPSFKVFCVFT